MVDHPGFRVVVVVVFVVVENLFFFFSLRRALTDREDALWRLEEEAGRLKKELASADRDAVANERRIRTLEASLVDKSADLENRDAMELQVNMRWFKNSFRKPVVSHATAVSGSPKELSEIPIKWLSFMRLQIIIGSSKQKVFRVS